MIRYLLRRLEQNPFSLFSESELTEVDRVALKAHAEAGLLIRSHVTSFIEKGRLLLVSEADDGKTWAFDPDDPDCDERELGSETGTQFQVDLLRLAWRIAAHNALNGSVALLDERVVFLGEVPPAISVTMVLGGSDPMARALAASIPGRLPSSYVGHVVVCPTIRLPPDVVRLLEERAVVVATLADDALNLAPTVGQCIARLAPASKIAGHDPVSGLRWGVGFHSVVSKGVSYEFSTQSGAVVEILFEAWKNGTPFIHQSHLLERAGSGGQELRDLFRDHPAWGVLIISGPTRGTFGLDP